MQPTFRMTFDVMAEDIDPLGHVNNISYVRWIQDIAVAHSSAVGLDFATYGQMGGIFVVRRHEIDYLRPVLRGDAVEACTWVGSVMAAKCLRHTELRRRGGADDVVARATTVWGFVDVKTGRPTRIPPIVRGAFGVPQRGESRDLGGEGRSPPGDDPKVVVAERTVAGAEDDAVAGEERTGERRTR
jgi:acyl-CoA thioester hydrolase